MLCQDQGKDSKNEAKKVKAKEKRKQPPDSVEAPKNKVVVQLHD